MKEARWTIYADHDRNMVSKYINGHFCEHASDVIYGGIYDPGHPLADEDGFRKDVLEALRDVHIPMLRYPGGNFVSNYHWINGIGPIEDRPVCYDYAWNVEDDNRFGTVEFIKLCRKLNAEPYICLNMGSGTAEEALHWLEFCNGTGNSEYVQMRKKLGYEEPFHVKYWGLGNEMYGDWQYGKCSAEEYAQKAMDFAKALKWYDPSVSLVACGYDIGSEWNYIVAKKLNALIDHLAIHHYSIGYGVFDMERYDSCMYLPEYITKLTKVAYADIIAGTDDSLTHIKVAWDEWNTYAWNLEGEDDSSRYNLKNAILTAELYHGFLKNSDIISLAGYSPFVNKSGAIKVTKDLLLKRTQYYVFKMLSDVTGDECSYLESRLECDTCTVEEVVDRSNKLPASAFSLNAKAAVRYVQTPYLDGVALMSNGNLILSVINKSLTDDYLLDLQIFGMQISRDQMKQITLYHDDPDAANTMEEPFRIVPKEDAPKKTEDGKILIRKHSYQIISVKNTLQ